MHERHTVSVKIKVNIWAVASGVETLTHDKIDRTISFTVSHYLYEEEFDQDSVAFTQSGVFKVIIVDTG